MPTSRENNKRIAKNTLFLYARMLIMMAIALYTSRVILNTLGVVDYGINNVVGGVVAMFGFLNGAMSTSIQRYITFELGRGDMVALKRIFTTSIQISTIIGILIVILSETIGLWFFYNKMVMPAERMDAAFWVLQLSIISTFVAIMSYPYNADIIAHEKMDVFAYISLLEAVLKLLVVYLLVILDFDKLILLSFMWLCVQLLIRFIYNSYCTHHFEESKLIRVFDRKLIKEMFSFAGWNLWGNLAGVLFSQGLNMLLNMFFGPVVNAARAVAVQVEGAIMQFSSNFQTALNPQITKTYAQNDLQSMHKLIYRSSKYSFMLLLLLSLPVMIEATAILKLWLKIVPEWTEIFFRIIICISIIDAVARPLMVAAAATGDVKVYQSVVGGILLAILPISYVVLKLGGNPASVFIVHLLVCIVAFIVRLYIIRPMIHLSISDYMRRVVLRCLIIAACSVVVPMTLYKLLDNSFLSVCTVCLVSVLSVAVCSFFIGLSINERSFILSKVETIIHRRHD